jgi:hypothetical protein
MLHVLRHILFVFFIAFSLAICIVPWFLFPD